jgi:hypothetical protein
LLTFSRGCAAVKLAFVQIHTLENQVLCRPETLALAQQFEQYLKSGSGHASSKRHLGL